MEAITTVLHPNCTKFEVDLKSKVLIQYFEPEKVEFKQGDAVLVRDDDDGRWIASVFKSYNTDGSDHIHSTFATNWKQCIPFDPELVGTINKPKL